MYIYIYIHTCMYICMYVCMYVCKYVCMYVCMHACMYVCMYVCICVYVYMCICVYVYMCICVYVYMCICVYVYMCICVYVCICMYVYIYTYIYIIYIYIYIYTYMHIRHITTSLCKLQNIHLDRRNHALPLWKIRALTSVPYRLESLWSQTKADVGRKQDSHHTCSACDLQHWPSSWALGWFKIWESIHWTGTREHV